MDTVLVTCLVKENTSAVKIPSFMVIFFAFLAKIIGTSNCSATYRAGAIPDASMVTTLVIPAFLKYSAKVRPISRIKVKSTW